MATLAFSAFSLVGVSTVYAATPTPAGCTGHGVGIGIQTFTNGIPSEPGHLGDVETYLATPALTSNADCNIVFGTIYFAPPSVVKADSLGTGSDLAPGGVPLSGVITVATGVNITRISVLQGFGTATCTSATGTQSGNCIFVIPGSYTLSSADLISGTCTSGTINPCIIRGVVQIKGTAEDAFNSPAQASTQGDTVVLIPSIQVTKTATAKVEIDGTISVTANVTNNGNTELNGLSVSDSQAGALTCSPTATGATLAAGASTTCTGSYTAPGTPGTASDTVTATGTDDLNGATGSSSSQCPGATNGCSTVSATATATTLVIQPAISVTKTATAKVDIGGTISVSVNVTNTGDTALTGVTAVDDHAGALTCLATTLAAGASTTCTGSYTAPTTAGTVTDTVTASGTDQTGAGATATATATTLVIQPAISVTKTATAKVEVGGTISVSANLTNTGTTQLTGVTAVDDHAGALTCLATTLAAGASTTCTGSYTAPTTAGTVTDTVTASGTDQTGAGATATATATTTVIKADISVTKTASSKVEVGGTISVNATVTNTGDTALTGVTAVDDHAGALTCLATTLAAGASTSCTGTYTAPTTAGTVTDTVTASGTDQTGAGATATATATTTIVNFGISVTKTATAKVEVGGTISVSANVTNTGSSTLTGVSATDDHAGALTCLATTLAAGESTTCTGSYTAPGTPGTVTDTVTASGSGQIGAPVTATATATTTVIQVGVSITKACTPSTQTAPGTITWTIVVTNSGTNPTETVSVSDSLAGIGPFGPVTLAQNASQTFTATTSGLAAGTYTNTANATASDQTGATATASASATCTVTAPAQITRTYGYWAQHWRFTDYVFQHDLGGSISWSCVTLSSTGDVLAGMKASISFTTTGTHRTALDQARMILAQQLIAAILNNAAFGSAPTSPTIAQAEADYCGTNAATILSDANALDQFNTSGDNLSIPATDDSCPPTGGFNGKCLSIISDPKGSDALAAPEYADWDTPGSVNT